jgi:Asp/Glu/hydantoin racemase
VETGKSAKRIGLVHTVLGLAGLMDGLIKERHPGVEVFHFVDEKLLADLLANGGLDASITARMTRYGEMAAQAGADLVLSTCSSTSPAIDVARKTVQVPFLKIDDAMAERAVSEGTHIGLLCTASSTVAASRGLLESHASAKGRSIRITPVLKEEAYRAKFSGDQARHDAIVSETAIELARETDLVVLAQASMAHLADELSARTGRPVLASPRLCVEALSAWL